MPFTVFRIRTALLVLLGGILLWSACRKTDFENPEFVEHDAQFAFPLFNTTLRLDDLLFQVLNDSLPGDTLLIAPDGTMTLYYSGDVAQKPATDIFKSFTGGLFPLADTVTVAPFDTIAGVTITEARLKKGRLGISCFYSYQAVPLTCRLTIPQMTTPDGSVYHHDFVVPAMGGYTSPALDISGNILLSNDNTLEFVYDARTPDGTRVKVESFPGIPGLIALFDSLEFSYLQGYWGYSEYPLTRDTIEIDINQTDLKGNIRVENPRVRMRIANSWGFPTRGIVKTMVFKGQNGDTIPLTNTVFPLGYVDFAYPALVANEVGQTKYTDIYLDTLNSNIDDIFNLQPTQLIYEVAGISNANQDPSITGFITDQSIISLNMQVVLDLVGAAKNFGAEQTLDLNFGEYSDLDTADIEFVEFKLVTENNTPIDINLQVYFQDENGNNIDSLFLPEQQPIMKSAPVSVVNGERIATGTERKESFIGMNISRFNRIRKAKTAYLKTAFTTAEGGEKSVKLLAQNQIAVKMRKSY
jgi:hypothetical protein